MRKLLAAATLLAAASPASAFLVYDGFDYTEGENLATGGGDIMTFTGQTNPFGQPWVAAGPSDTDNPLVVGPGLSVPGIPASTGLAIGYGGNSTGSAARIEVGPFEATSPINTVYYSLALQITNPANLQIPTSAVGNQFAGFNTLKGPQSNAPGVLGARLHARQSVTEGKFQLGFSKNGNSAPHVSWQELDLNTTYFVVASYTLNPAVGDDVAQFWLYADPTADAGSLAAPVAHVVQTGNGDPDLSTGRIESFAFRQGGIPTETAGMLVDEVRVDTSWAGVVPAPAQDWIGATGGDWSQGSNWAGGTAPNAPGKHVKFAGAAAPLTVTVDTPHAVGSIDLDGTGGYTIAGTSALTVSTNSSINVFQGDHAISAPVTAEGNLTFNVAPAGSLTVSEQIATSPGSVFLKAGYGTVTVKNVRADHLAIYAGKVVVADDGGANGTTVVKSLTLAQHFLSPAPPTGINELLPPIGSIDFRDNDLIVDYAPGASSPEFVLRDFVKATAEGGTSGIFFSVGDGNTVLAIAEGTESGLTDLNGIGFDDTAVIGKHTYYGDANLDGQVTSDDYVSVDVGIGVGDSWVEGDFDFSGTVTSDDYVAIDVNLGQGAGNPLAWAELKAEMIALHTAMFGAEYVDKLAYAEANGFGATIVPEPAALSGIGIAAATLLGRRRRA